MAVLRRYGKDVNMRFLRRDIEKVKQMIENCTEFSHKNLVRLDERQQYDCRICHDKNFSKFTNVWGYEYAQCSSCESIVLLNIPNAKKLYEKEGTPASVIYLDEEVFQRRVETIGLPKIEFVIDAIGEHNHRMWYDVGCGVGELLEGLKQNYSDQIEGIGVEIDPAEIRFGRDKGLRIISGYIDPENTADEIIEIICKADIVSMLNVLEHMEKPDEIMKFYKRHMKSGAYLVIEVPRHPSLASFANLISPGLTYRHIAPPVHLQVFSDKAIEKMTAEDYRLAGTWGFGQGFTDILTSTMLIGNVKEKRFYESLMDISNKVQKAIDMEGFSDQMIYVLEKK
jgi:SAM-dependent methyltransferase